VGDLTQMDREIPFAALAGVISELDDALGRLDERLAASPVADGLRARLDFAEVAAIALSGGDLVDADDLLLHDAQMDARLPTHELAVARQLYLAARRRAGAGDPQDHLTLKGLRRLAGLPGVIGGQGGASPSGLRADIDALLRLADELEHGDEAEPAVEDPPAPEPVHAAETAGEEEPTEVEDAFRRWQALRQDEAKALPPALSAILLQTAWAEMLPLQKHAWLASIIGPLELRARGRSKHVLLPAEIGLRLARRHRGAASAMSWQEGVAALFAAVQDVEARHQRLLFAYERVQKLASTKRGDSRLLAAGELAVEKPLITLKTVAAHCGVTERAAQGLIAELSGLLVEVSGRQRYRAWKLS
jgi:hypothetical protein